MSLARTAYKDLEAWKSNPHRKALLIDGARQVGKTYLVREFAQARYEVVLEINFIKTPSAKVVFEGDLDANTIIAGLTAFSSKPLAPGKTLIFLDEIQECPRARTAIKFLVDDGRYDYIESGSLLGVTYREVPSLPVGYEQQITLYPLTIEEFFSANGIQDSVLSEVEQCFQKREAVPPALHERLKRLFFYYLAIGGMPAVVQSFVDTHDVAQALEIQQGILALYRQDIARYASNKAHVHAIFDQIPAELNKKNKRFMLSDLAKSARMERYASDFMWVADAGVALPCYNVTEPKAPLAINRQHSLLKVFLCDVGLLCAASLDAVQFELIRGNVRVNWGSILENALAQQLVAHGFKLFYFDKPKVGEVDFVVQLGGTVLPLEAKSGPRYREHASLDKVLAVSDWGIDEAFVLCSDNVSTEGKVVYLPWYMLMFLERPTLPKSFIVE